MNAVDQKQLLVSGPTARKVLDIGTTKYWALVKEGRIKTVRLCGRTMAVYASLEALTEQQHQA